MTIWLVLAALCAIAAFKVWLGRRKIAITIFDDSDWSAAGKSVPTISFSVLRNYVCHYCKGPTRKSPMFGYDDQAKRDGLIYPSCCMSCCLAECMEKIPIENCDPQVVRDAERCERELDEIEQSRARFRS